MAWLSGDGAADKHNEDKAARTLLLGLQRLRSDLVAIETDARRAFPQLGRRSELPPERRVFYDLKISLRGDSSAGGRGAKSQSFKAYEALEEFIGAWDRLRPLLSIKAAWPLLPVSAMTGWGSSKSVPLERAIPTRLARWARGAGIDLKPVHAILIGVAVSGDKPKGGFDAALKRWTKALHPSRLDFDERQELAAPKHVRDAALLAHVQKLLDRGRARLMDNEAESIATRLEAGDTKALLRLIELGQTADKETDPPETLDRSP